ncbi:hypothetical protein ABZ945_32225, partial [Streptomyces sp. NPDC046887]
RARGAAADAENQAAAAGSAASLAEQEASVAQGAAAQAEQDAADAKAFAESAEKHAASAETAAKNAGTYAKEADEAAKRAEAYRRELERKEREEAARGGGNASGGDLSEAQRKALEAAGISVAEFEAAKALKEKNLLDYLTENGGELLVELFAEDIKECLDDPDIGICLWAIVQNLGPVKFVKIGSKLPKIMKAIQGIDDFLERTDKARKLVEKAEKIVERAQAVLCPTKSKSKSAQRVAFMAAPASGGDGFDGWNGFEGWADCEYIPPGQSLPKGGIEVALDTLALRNLRNYHFAGGSMVTDKKGLFNSGLTLGDLRDVFYGAISDQGEWKQASGGTAYREKSVCLDPKKKFGKSSRETGEQDTHCLTIVVSVHGDLVTMYPIVPTS